MLSVRELRSQLGMTQAAFARAVGSSIRSVINWERGITAPDLPRRIMMRNLAHRHGLPKRMPAPGPTRTYNDDKMKEYEGKPGPRWLSWSGQKRASFYAHRARYASIRADIESGRALGQLRGQRGQPQPKPIVPLLDSAPDLDSGV